ncbi:hypothetical protein AVENLUH13518_01759 [Acinetobacter venetianus]|uniref:Uncharacterized protein n=1 Tax=Acinetobacter venetianus TaxID=52133 RepID=A0A150HUP9_9GAMM|nr:hypothetical protein AVENLUH13518_01759 [Acinetobacter venetianus]
MLPLALPELSFTPPFNPPKKLVKAVAGLFAIKVLKLLMVLMLFSKPSVFSPIIEPLNTFVAVLSGEVLVVFVKVSKILVGFSTVLVLRRPELLVIVLVV